MTPEQINTACRKMIRSLSVGHTMSLKRGWPSVRRLLNCSEDLATAVGQQRLTFADVAAVVQLLSRELDETEKQLRATEKKLEAKREELQATKKRMRQALASK